MDAIERESDNAVDQLYKLTSCLREQLGNTNASVLYDLKKYYSRAWENYMNYKYEVIFKSVMRNLERGMSEGLFRSDINPEIIAFIRVGCIEMSFNNEFFHEDKFSLVEIHEQMFEHFTYGILSAEGMKLFETYKQKEA